MLVLMVHLLSQSSLGSDTARLLRISATDGSEEETLASDPRCDVGRVMISDIDRSVQAVSFNYLRREWSILDKDVDADFEVGLGWCHVLQKVHYKHH